MGAPNYNWRAGPRGDNLIAANPERLESADKCRWATGRNVKRSLGDGRYDGVQIWTLRDRHLGKARVVDTYRSREDAVKWVEGK